MKQKFIDKKFNAEHLGLIKLANKIIAQYQADGYTMTLRQIYYQLVTRNAIKNTVQEYKRLGSIINDGRMAGLIDWSAIEDRGRNVREGGWWDTPMQSVDAASNSYREDLWLNQRKRVLVMIEKDALSGVISGVCDKWRTPYIACKGYMSQSEMYDLGRRLLRTAQHQKCKTLILHLGDHDPSGIDMTRDNRDRLAIFSDLGGGRGSSAVVKRIALNYDQIEQYNPPPNPAKETDGRFLGYQKEYGNDSWELDALDPAVISGLVEAEIEAVVDPARWAESKAKEKAGRERIKSAAKWMKEHG